MYNELKNYNIVGNERKNFIYKITKIHINSIYNWIKNINVDTNNTLSNTDSPVVSRL